MYVPNHFKVDDVAKLHQYIRDYSFGLLVIADDGQGLYADIDGTLTHSADREALDEVWTFVADSWFEGGKADPDVCLLRFTPRQAEVSVTTTSGIAFFYEMAKAQISDDKPDLGSQGVVTF